MSQLKETCSLLDETLLEYFETLEAVYAKQEEFENCLKEGYIQMAKARYSMGGKCVGELQYDTENMEALTLVKISDDDVYPVFSQVFPEEAKLSIDGKAGDGLRKRITKEDKDMSELSEAVQEIGLQEDKEKIKKTNNASPSKKDPLKWFGVLVPQALKDSQNRFKLATTLSCEIATLKTKLCSLQSHYSQLMQEKHNILDSVSVFAS